MASFPLTQLEILAEVASYRLSSLPPGLHLNRTIHQTTKIKEPRSCSPHQINSYEELRALSAQELINRFTTSTEDELSRKFTYKCTFAPSKCHSTSYSYGSKKRAWSDMKDHLKNHVESAGTVVKTPIMDEKYSSLEKSASCSGFLQEVSSMEVRIPESHDYTESSGSDSGSVKKMLTFTNMDVINRKFDEMERSSEEPLSTEYYDGLLKYFKKVTSTVEKDHNYFLNGTSKRLKLKASSLTVSTIDPPIVPNIVQPQFIIETPAFPYVHGAACLDLAGIEELKADYTLVNPKHQYQCCENHPDFSEAKKNILGTGKKFPRSSRKQITGSVLECMENQAKFKSSGTFRVPKNPQVLNDNNSENLENLQKIEKELALKLIADTRAQKKKPHKGPLKCKICQDKQFTAQATLIHHYRSHAGIKLHICKICDHRFTRQHSLNYHMLIHENRSRFHCSIPSCDRTFRHPSHFKDHVRNHTGETPYECSDCHTHFKTRNTYKRHLRVRHEKLLTAKGNIEDIKTN